MMMNIFHVKRYFTVTFNLELTDDLNEERAWRCRAKTSFLKTIDYEIKLQIFRPSKKNNIRIFFNINKLTLVV